MQLRAELLLLLSAVSLAGCEVAGDIFQAGFWTGIALVALLLALVGFAFLKLRR